MKLKSLIAGALCFASLSTTAFASENTIPEPMNKYTPGVNSAPYNQSFTDVNSNDWYYDAIMTLTDGGILAGYGDGTYGPNDQLTRLQVHTIGVRIRSSTADTWDGKFSEIGGVDVSKDKGMADRAFALLILMDKAAWGNVYLADNTLHKKTEITVFEKLVGSNWEDYTKTLSANRSYNLEEKYGTKYPIVSAHFYQPIYDTLYAMGLQNKELNTISSIDELSDAAEIRRWIDENAETMRNHFKEHLTWSIEDTKEYCEYLIALGYNIGLFRGVDDKGTFAPYAPVTRAQVAQALFNTGWTYVGAIDND